VSALLSAISATWSMVGMQLLVYAALATGPLGALRPWWLPPLWLLAGVCWTLVLLVPGWLLRPRTVEQRRVAAVYKALAANLRTLGADGLGAARQGVTAALNTAYEELLNQRAAESGRDRRLARLVALLNQARLAAEASAALASAGEQPPPQAAAQADALADAVLDGTAVPEIGEPPAANTAMLVLYGALNGAARVVSGGGPEATGGASWQPQRHRPLLAVAGQVRQSLATTFTIRLMLCVGVAAVCSEVLPLQRSYWVVVAVAVVLKPDFGSVFARALQYVAGTLLGAIISALILAAGPPDLTLLAPLVVFAALLPYAMSRNYGLWTVFFTPLVVLLIDLLNHGGWELAQARLIDILLGCAIVLLIGYAPWPSSWHANLPRDSDRAAEQAAQYLQQALSEPAPGTAASAHARARKQVAALRIDFQRALAEPQRVRQRVAAWWPAVIALEWLLEAVTATAVTTAGQPPPATAVDQLSTALRQIAAAVRSGTPVRPQAQLPRPPSLELVSNTVRAVQHALPDAAAAAGPAHVQHSTATA
jgi:uncharacterized membrane protein YccC